MTTKDQYERLLIILKSLKGVELLEDQPEEPGTPEELEELDTLLAALLKAPPQGRSFAHQATTGGPNWEGEHHSHPIRKQAHNYGQAAGELMLHAAHRLNHHLNHEHRTRLSHFFAGMAHRLHPGPEPV
jgi:hypothetical protein